jgi:hypothetical protein
VAIRVECDSEGFENCWLDFRDSPWPFGDRRAMLEGQSDLAALEVILSYIEGWLMINVKNKKVIFNPEGDIDAFNDMDEIIVNWVISAWFKASGLR